MNSAVLNGVTTYEQERGKPAPSENHGAVQANLIAEFVRNKQYRVISELSLELQGRPLTPDISVYMRKALDFRHDHIRLTEAPLVTVEIFSATQSYQDIMEKVEAYLQSGVQTCWVVSPPQHAITIYTADGSQKTYVDGQVRDPATGLTAEMEAVFS